MPRRRIPLVTLIALAALLLSAEGIAAPGMLTRLAITLEAEPQGVRADFAAVALSEMIAAYELEFDKLSLPGQVSRAEIAKQARWARAVQQFLAELYAARDELDAGAAVELIVSPPAAVQFMVGERMLAVASPRIDNPQSIEQQIVQVYCDSFACDPQILEPLEPAAEKLAKRGGWSFAAGQGSTYETNDGLGFMFTDVRERSRKERICLQLGEELNRLSMALASARRRGQMVDVQALRINASGRGDDQLVVLSTTGNTLRLHLPALLDAPDVVEVARNWIAARSKGVAYRQRFPRAERLMAKLLLRSQR